MSYVGDLFIVVHDGGSRVEQITATTAPTFLELFSVTFRAYVRACYRQKRRRMRSDHLSQGRFAIQLVFFDDGFSVAPVLRLFGTRIVHGFGFAC
jgi:hypothetical protein